MKLDYRYVARDRPKTRDLLFPLNRDEFSGVVRSSACIQDMRSGVGIPVACRTTQQLRACVRALMKAPIRSVSDRTPIITRVFAQCCRARTGFYARNYLRTRLPGPGLNFTRISDAAIYRLSANASCAHTACVRASESDRCISRKFSDAGKDTAARDIVSMEKRSRGRAITSTE